MAMLLLRWDSKGKVWGKQGESVEGNGTVGRRWMGKQETVRAGMEGIKTLFLNVDLEMPIRQEKCPISSQI